VPLRRANKPRELVRIHRLQRVELQAASIGGRPPRDAPRFERFDLLRFEPEPAARADRQRRTDEVDTAEREVADAGRELRARDPEPSGQIERVPQRPS